MDNPKIIQICFAPETSEYYEKILALDQEGNMYEMTSNVGEPKRWKLIITNIEKRK